MSDNLAIQQSSKCGSINWPLMTALFQVANPGLVVQTFGNKKNREASNECLKSISGNHVLDVAATAPGICARHETGGNHLSGPEWTGLRGSRRYPRCAQPGRAGFRCAGKRTG